MHFDMEKERYEIRAILIDGQGWFTIDDGEKIEPFLVNGEMASVTWFRQGTREYNGKYVVAIEYVK